MHDKCDPNQPIFWRKLNYFYSLLFHIIEGTMNESNLINNDKNGNRMPVEIFAKDNEKTIAKSKKINKLSET